MNMMLWFIPTWIVWHPGHGCRVWLINGLDWPEMGQVGLLKISFGTFWLPEPKCTETDLKKSKICPIGANTEILVPRWSYLPRWRPPVAQSSGLGQEKSGEATASLSFVANSTTCGLVDSFQSLWCHRLEQWLKTGSRLIKEWEIITLRGERDEE